MRGPLSVTVQFQADRTPQRHLESKMGFRNKAVRGLVVGSFLLFSQAFPAFAEKVTLACQQAPPGAVLYLTIDDAAKTLKEEAFAGFSENGTYPVRITDDAVTWASRGGSNTYYRQTAVYIGIASVNGFTNNYVPMSCVKAPPRPY
jgi:hypothetical protein